MKGKFAGKLAQYWPQLLVFTVFVGIFALLYAFRLGSHTPTGNTFEQPLYLGIQSTEAIVKDASFAPSKVLQYSLLRVDDDNGVLLRLVSVLIMLVAAGAFYLVLTKWHSHRTAVIATALFASSSYSLHHGRFANHEVLYLAVIPVFLLCGMWLKSKKDVSKMPVASVLLSLLLYIPGVWLLLLAYSIAFRKRITIAWKYVSKKTKIVTIAGSTITLLPLVIAVAMYPRQILTWIGLNRLEPFSLDTIVHQLAEIPLQLFFRGSEQPQLWLVNTPILDIFTLALFVLGVYAYWKGPHTLRARYFLASSGLAILLFILGGSVSLALLLPIVYFVVANGVAAMLVSWYTVFPRNPVARNIGIGILVAAATIACSYHVKRYFIAWPDAPETRQALSVTAERSDTIKE